MDKNKKSKRILWGVIGVLTVILAILLVCAGCLSMSGGESAPSDPPATQNSDQPQTTAPSQTESQPTVPENTEPVMLERLTEWYEKNDALVGWLKIDGTVIDYPVIHTPEDPDEYLRKNIEGKFSMEGTLFVEGNCSMDPESDNIIIYGHNMKRGTMFHDLMNYKKKSYWEERPLISYSTLYEERTYEIVAAFYDRVYYTHEKVFKFYQFIDYETEEEFDRAIVYYKEKSEYDTGVEPVFGDKLLTLVTCSYHEDNGRFVVVAREVTEDNRPGA